MLKISMPAYATSCTRRRHLALLWHLIPIFLFLMFVAKVCANSPLKIGICGADALASEFFKIIVNSAINGHLVVIRKLDRKDFLTGTQMLFLGAVAC